MTTDKPWIKGTKEGALYIDTSNPEWQKWFKQYVLSNYERFSKIIKK